MALLASLRHAAVPPHRKKGPRRDVGPGQRRAADFAVVDFEADHAFPQIMASRRSKSSRAAFKPSSSGRSASHESTLRSHSSG